MIQEQYITLLSQTCVQNTDETTMHHWNIVGGLLGFTLDWANGLIYRAGEVVSREFASTQELLTWLEGYEAALRSIIK